MAKVRANGIEIEVEQSGPENGPPLLMIMGLGAQLIFWPDELVAALADRGFRVIRFDNRDVGLSTKIHGERVPPVGPLMRGAFMRRPPPVPYTLEDMALDTVGVLDALDIPSAHVVGASMGGMIAQTVSIMHPHRVRSLTSIMSNSGRRRDSMSKPRALRTLLAKPPRSREEAMERQVVLFRTIGSPRLGLDENYLRERAGRAYDRCFYPAGFARQFAAIAGSSVTPRHHALSFVRVPSLVVHGSADPLVPVRGGRATAAALKGSRFVEIPDMGHDLPRAIWPRLVDEIHQVARRAEPHEAVVPTNNDLRRGDAAPAETS